PHYVGKRTFDREKSCGITVSAALRATSSGDPNRRVAHTVSGHGTDRPRMLTRSGGIGSDVWGGSGAAGEKEGTPRKPPRRRGSLTSSDARASEGCWTLAKPKARSFDLDQVSTKFPPAPASAEAPHFAGGNRSSRSAIGARCGPMHWRMSFPAGQGQLRRDMR